VITWTRLHGFASLEIEGAFASMGIDAETIFQHEVDALVTGERAFGANITPRPSHRFHTRGPAVTIW
jgi:Tetracyclin repressor-like, C-terminal domain